MKKYIIYNDDVCEYANEFKKDIIENLQANNCNIDDDAIYQEAYAMINNDYEYMQELINCYENIYKPQKILCIANFGLWYGRRKAQKYFNNLYDALRVCYQDNNKLYFKKNNSTLELSASHHDGTNYYKFYAIIDGKKKAIKYNQVIN